MTQQAAPLHIRKGHERRLLLGHPWVFSNEIISDLRAYEPGTLVDVYTHGGTFVGRGYINPRSLITVRLLSYRREAIDGAFFRRRLEAALQRRQRLYPEARCYRLAFSEGDFLPGLIVDRYDDHVVIQTLTLGMDLRLEMICETLEQLLHPQAILARNEVAIRALEGLPLEKKLLRGSLQVPVEVWDHDLRLRVNPWEGQKTGLYLDQCENRWALRTLLGHGRVLDAFCYSGAWGLHAARAGAREVLGIDESTKAIQWAQEQARENGLAEICRFQAVNVFDYLKEADARHDRFEAIILDPPAFVKSRSKLREGLEGYWEINRRAMRMVKPGGYLITSSCSYHVDPGTFRVMLSRAARAAHRSVTLLEMRAQGRDHPTLLPVAESAYLKCAVLTFCD